MSFLFCGKEDFADYYDRLSELFYEVTEDCMPFSFTLEDDFDNNNMVEF